MATPEANKVFGSLLSPTFTFTHGTYSELHHPFADTVCLDLALSHLKGSGVAGRDLVFIGSGFGAELRSALFAGAKSVIGLDQAADQVSFAQSLANVITNKNFIINLLESDRVVSRLYPHAVLLSAATRCQNEIYQLCQLRRITSVEEYHKQVSIKQCDVLRDNIVEALDGAPRDVLVGNIMLHWLVRESHSLSDALDKLAPAVRPKGVAVFSAPYHFIEQEDASADEMDRKLCVYDTAYYRAMRRHLLEILPEQKLPAWVDFRKVDGMIIREREVKEGSQFFTHVATCRWYFSPLVATMADVLNGLGLYEAVLRTVKPDRDLVKFINLARSSAFMDVGIETAQRERPATFVYFFVFRRN